MVGLKNAFVFRHPKATGTVGVPGLTPKIPGPFLPISTSKMLKFSKKSQKKFKKIKMLKFQPHKDYDLSDLLKKSCQKILKILTMVACLSSCNPLWVLWNFRG
jgi:hypothetical protein